MNSSEVRRIFLNYFKKNNHELVHSGSLVPENDPTLMFANSGMVQFKNTFTGKEIRDYTRAVTAQKCVRAGGKHNDLENVGYTARHHTFFEMLGNFSFGDYFKDLAIELAWNLITKEYGIDKKKLVVTVFEEDIEAYDLWKKISGLSDDKIIKINTSDNFWSMGETGPCGPCSEIFYDHGDKFFGGPPGSKDEHGDRFIEIWNLVFMQFEQISKEERINLPKPSIDTGMGLERITALLQNTNDNYKTDIFTSLINKSIELSNSDKNQKSPSHRVIADHLRSSAFLISDGVLPSNEGRGYVLRRIMRRGMRHAHSLGNTEPVFNKIFPILLSNMKDSYPELERAKDLINNTLFNEETKFKQTIDNGLKILEDEIKKTKNNLFNGEVAFKLYDTYGFPLDLTQDYLKNKNIDVDILTFDKNMIQQKERARKSWKGTGDSEDDKIWFEVVQNLEPTDFVGYDQVKTESLVKKIIVGNKEVKKIKNGEKGIIILNQTTFYGESGGQIGDEGNLFNDQFNFKTYNTTKIFGNYFLHWGQVIKGFANINDQVSTSINVKKRDLIRNNHSSTHLLHASLRKILGNHVFQKGSLVNDEKLRFDFSHNFPLSDTELEKIENLVNKVILQNTKVNTKILDHQSAINEGAIALFGEKYGEEVRVIAMGEDTDSFSSKELCGGTHVNYTGEINKFKIINQYSVASGVRRIEAVSNIGVDNFINIQEVNTKEANFRIEQEINKYLNLIKKIQPGKIININKNITPEEHLKDIKKTYNDIQFDVNISENKDKIIVEKIGNYNLVYLLATNYPSKALKLFIDEQKNAHPFKSIIVLVSSEDTKVSIIVGITKDITETFDATNFVKIASTIVGGNGGGGRKDLAQGGGNKPANVKKIFNEIKSEILKLT
ncbi:alanine--tRNA ligase [Alphaproteobacteria bacterium]|nr:alanine--tRNA ligase [Alphaproteobacteria bacterium]